MTKTIDLPERGTTLPPLPEVDDVTRRELLIGAAGLLLLPSACGSNGEGGAGEPSGETRTVGHALGTAEVPADPRRVVALDTFAALQNAVELGVPVVGCATFPHEDPFPEFLSEEETGGIEGVGHYTAPNLEKIAALEPDLIVGSREFVEIAGYDELSRMAPTVALAFTYDWKRTSRKVAEAYGREGEMGRLIGDHERRAEGLRAALDERSVDPEVTAMRLVEDGVRIHTNQHFAGRVLEEAGVRRPPNQTAEDPQEGIIEVSPELIPELDADAIFYFASGGGFDPEASERTFRRFRENPLWRGLRAVREGRVWRVGEDHWLAVGGPRSAGLILDDLEKYLLDERG